MNELGVSAKVTSMTAGPAYPEFGENVKDFAENVSPNSWWHENANYKDKYHFESSLKHNEIFKQRFKRKVTYLEAAATAACQTLVIAI